MIDNIKNKSILLISTNFYNYDVAVKEALLQLGAKSVILKNAISFRGSLREHITWNTPYFLIKEPKARTNWTNKLISEIESYRFDVMLCLENMAFKKSFIDYLRSRNPKIKIFLFLWDTFRTQQPRYWDYLPKFDYVFSFDRDDAKKYGLMYYPDFYIDKEFSYSELKYDISFIGTMYESSTFYRAELLHHINTFCQEHHLKTFFYLRYNKVVEQRKMFVKQIFLNLLSRKYDLEVEKYLDDGFLHTGSIPLEEVDRIFNESKVILDLNHKKRQGMTINCITALAKGKKLITTNKRIKEEDFYNPDNIYIIDDENPKMDIDFFIRSSDTHANMKHLRLDNWLKYILNR